jgi:phosphoserine phosphatase
LQTADKSKPRLVVFDVEGVLIPKNRFIFDVGKSLGLPQLLKMLFIGFLYGAGFVALKSALKRIFKIMQGVKIEDLMQIFDEIPSKPQLQSLFAQLKLRDCKIALISSGIPTVLVEKLANTLGADYAVGIEVGLNDDALTGEIWGDAIEANGKRTVLTRILDAEGLNLEDCVVVADDRNNSCIFLSGMQKIGYNPDFVLRVKADSFVTGKLSKILPVIDGKPKQRSLPSKNDLLREAIHASGFFVPVIAGSVGVYPVALMICVVSALYALSELLRMNKKNLPVISAITRNAALPTELYEFTAAPLYFAAGILLTLLLFPAPVNGAAIAIFTLGDSTASLFGGLISKKPLPFNKGKTLEGSLFGFFFAFLGGAFFVSPVLALIAAAIAMAIESLPSPVNDNILIPLGAGLALMLMI